MLSKAMAQGEGGLFRFLPAERAMLWFIGLIGVLAVGLALVMQRNVDWPPFLIGYVATLGFAAIGGYLREVKATPRLALGLIGLAIFSGFTAVSSMFIYALFPLPNPLIDTTLIQIDSVLGYHWPSLIAWLADHPGIATTLGYVYRSSLLQILLTIILLAAFFRPVALHRFLVVGIVTLTMAVTIWWFMPSVGPSAFLPVPEAHRIATGLYYSPAYGEFLKSLVEIGPPEITPDIVTGVVAFPSYHMIMALMVFWYTRGTWAFLPAALINAAMIPATLSHGAHHLIDIIAGVLVFAIGVWIANQLIRPDPQS